MVRSVITHYRDPNITLPADHADDISHQWIDRLLADLPVPARPAARRAPAPDQQRVGGCCRDFSCSPSRRCGTRAMPARVRIGFADYFFVPGWHHDHVVVDYWDGARWVLTDPQIGPGDWPFDPADMPRPDGAGTPFATAAAVWTAHRRGEIDARRSAASTPRCRIRGDWFIHGYVIGELAARQGDELLLY